MIFWDISMGYLRQDQNNIYSRANFTHYWDNSLLYSLVTCVYKSFHFDREEQEFLLFNLSCQDCSILFFQVVFFFIQRWVVSLHTCMYLSPLSWRLERYSLENSIVDSFSLTPPPSHFPVQVSSFSSSAMPCKF